MLLSIGAAAASESAIALQTATGTLNGTLALPEGRGRVPVMLLIAGSGPTDRDGNGPGPGTRNDALKLLAAALADAGIATVRYDKRGIGGSAAAGPAEADLRFDTYAQDAADWLRLLSSDPRFQTVGVIGHSEGATLGLLAARQAAVGLYVSIAGPSEPAADLLRRQLAGRLPPALAVRSDAILHKLEAGATDSDVPPELSALYRPSVQPYLISWFKVNPTDEIARLGSACLVVQGDTDIQTSVADARALAARKSPPDGGRAQPRCEVAVIGGMNHVLKQVPPIRAKQIESYGDPSLPLSPELVSTLTRFISAAGRPQ